MIRGSSQNNPQDRSRVRAVLYDIDGTLYELGRMRRRMALEMGRAALTSPLRTLRQMRMIQAYRRAQESLREEEAGGCQYEAAARMLGVPSGEIRPAVEEWMEQRPLAILPRFARQPVIEMIRLLNGHGIPQAAYSDYPARSKIEVFGLTSQFEFHLCSSDEDVGAFKPSPEGFLKAAARWELEPSEIVYVGDRPEVDGRGAEAAGMTFVPVEHLTAERVRRAAAASSKEICLELFGL